MNLGLDISDTVEGLLSNPDIIYDTILMGNITKSEFATLIELIKEISYGKGLAESREIFIQEFLATEGA